MIWIGLILGALFGLVVGWSYGAVWAHEKTRKCEECGRNRICPECKKMVIIA